VRLLSYSQVLKFKKQTEPATFSFMNEVPQSSVVYHEDTGFTQDQLQVADDLRRLVDERCDRDIRGLVATQGHCVIEAVQRVDGCICLM
jgi:hypothetical protein